MKVLDIPALLECFANDKDFIAEILESYEKDTSSRLTILDEAVVKHDAKTVASASHALKGISANMRLEPLREVFYQMETKGKAGDLGGVDDLLKNAHTLFSQFQSEYRDEIRTLK